MSKIALLGPEYSYSHLLGRKIFFGEELVLYSRIEEIFSAVVEQRAAKGIIPIENMLQGSVRIRHCLAAKNNNYIRIVSHPQALAQCSGFVAGKEAIESSSTSKAMEMAAQDESLAALGSVEAAERYELNILQQNLEDNPGNVTRFLLISLEETDTTEKARTSLLLDPKEDKPGLLFFILAPFASQNINLAKIESLPSGRKMGEYVFYIEIDGNVREERVKTALGFLKNSVEVCSLGSYEVKDLG